MRLLCLGANGTVAQSVIPALRALGADCVTVARTGPADRVWGQGNPIPNLEPCDAVIAFWGVVSNDPPKAQCNTNLALATMQWAAEAQANRVLHFSSAAVYPASDTPHVEDTPLAPASIYGQAKHAMEDAVLRARDPKQTVLRLGNVVGADSLKGPLTQGRATLHQFPDGTTPLRSYIAPGDLARVLLALAGAPQLPPVLNVAAPEPITMGDLVQADGITPVFTPAPENAQQRACLDTARLTRAIGQVCTAITPTQMIADWRRWSPHT
ncbi:NAD-dependent epimerase/dehydratase family protein [Pseudaestuariivita sp.]|uniref:NAD-dependent epimerase/dehydratase family protein n=1 Tax=Pseudaestuariivita sp. TaxID=2211669 RepID=UPI00405935C0